MPATVVAMTRRQGPGTSDDYDASDDYEDRGTARRREPERVLGAADAAELGQELVTELTGRPAQGVISLEPSDGGWLVGSRSSRTAGFRPPPTSWPTMRPRSTGGGTSSGTPGSGGTPAARVRARRPVRGRRCRCNRDPTVESKRRPEHPVGTGKPRRHPGACTGSRSGDCRRHPDKPARHRAAHRKAQAPHRLSGHRAGTGNRLVGP